MRNRLFILFLIVAIFGFILNVSSVDAKRSKKGQISSKQMETMSMTVDNLTKKMYANGLFSPTDNENLIDIKIKLDNQMLVSPDVSLVPLYYKVAVLYESRDMRDEAIDCFQTILENFADTAFAPKAKTQLKKMGVKVKETQKSKNLKN